MSDTDRRLYAQDEADYIVDDMDDDDIIREKDLEDEIDAIDEQELKNRNKIDELETEIEDLESELEDLDANDDSERIEEINKLVLALESQKEGLENIDYDERKEEIIERGREELREDKYDEIYDELDDPVEYFVVSRGLYTLEELIKNGPVFLDEDEMASDMISEDGRGHYLSSYDGDENEQEYDGITYYIYRVN
jgi:DNA repair exonuclease SbcCD ATPase subunit